MRIAFRILAVVAVAAAAPVYAQNLVPNGDFELLQVDDMGNVVLDAYGLEQPLSWFRKTSTPATDPTPPTELITPNNMNNSAGNNLGDDSDGVGTNSAALNHLPQEKPADFRSQVFATTPGETLIFGIDLKFIGVSTTEYLGIPEFYEGIRAQVRSFMTRNEENLGEGGGFKGETNTPRLEARNFTPNVWGTFTMPLVVPAEGVWTDIRITANEFGPADLLASGQVLIDNVRVFRLTADFDGSGAVDGLDLGVWKSNFGPTAAADADDDGDSDGADFLAWQQQVGLGAPPAAATAAAIPEPATAVLAAVGLLALAAVVRRGRS
jgi:hypothetical protein